MYTIAHGKVPNIDVHQSSFQLVYGIQDTCYVMVE